MYEYLKTEHWRHLRGKLIYKERRPCPCGETNTRTMELHHRTYERAGQEWEEDVVVVCHECHKAITRIEKHQKRRVSQMGEIRRICSTRVGRKPPAPEKRTTRKRKRRSGRGALARARREIAKSAQARILTARERKKDATERRAKIKLLRAKRMELWKE